jgi:hypothetical protein
MQKGGAFFFNFGMLGGYHTIRINLMADHLGRHLRSPLKAWR